MIAAVTDTHALIWYAMGPGRRLGRQARARFARAESRQALIYVPVIVLVEVAEAIHRGVVRCDRGYRRWTDQLLGSGGFLAVDLTAAIVREAESLYAVPERGDRLIAATAVHLGYPLITKDPALAKLPALKTIW
jgi:PIN domain nuclease of toxin-antitoxin system